MPCWVDGIWMDTPGSSYPAFGRADRRRLSQALAQAREARLYRRLRAVAEIAEGEPVDVVAKRARVGRSTVYRWIERYLAERAPSALADDRRSGRPRAAPVLADTKLRQLLTSDPCRFGYDANTWTVPLLASYLRPQGVVISARTLRRRIRAARFRWKRPRYVYIERAEHVGGLKRRLRARDVLLFTDWTLLRLFPPLRAMWAAIGTQAKVSITGQNARRVLFGTIHVRTARRTVYVGRSAGAHDVRAFLLALRNAYRRAGTIWLLADRASGHTAQATLALAEELRIEFVWLPKPWPELTAMDQLWKELKRDVAANRQAASIEDLAERARQWVLNLTPAQARRKSGMASSKFWLRVLSQDFWLPT
jgi:transposase